MVFPLFVSVIVFVSLFVFVFLFFIWIADIISFQKIYGLRGTRGLTAVLQLIYELRKNCFGWTGRGGWTSKVLQEVLADLKKLTLFLGGKGAEVVYIMQELTYLDGEVQN